MAHLLKPLLITTKTSKPHCDRNIWKVQKSLGLIEIFEQKKKRIQNVNIHISVYGSSYIIQMNWNR